MMNTYIWLASSCFFCVSRKLTYGHLRIQVESITKHNILFFLVCFRISKHAKQQKLKIHNLAFSCVFQNLKTQKDEISQFCFFFYVASNLKTQKKKMMGLQLDFGSFGFTLGFLLGPLYTRFQLPPTTSLTQNGAFLLAKC